MSIHSRIKERRLAMGFKSHQALANEIGVSWQTVQLWEKEGGTAPKRDRLDVVAKALGVSAEWLRSGLGDRDGFSKAGDTTSDDASFSWPFSTTAQEISQLPADKVASIDDYMAFIFVRWQQEKDRGNK